MTGDAPAHVDIICGPHLKKRRGRPTALVVRAMRLRSAWVVDGVGRQSVYSDGVEEHDSLSPRGAVTTPDRLSGAFESWAGHRSLSGELPGRVRVTVACPVCPNNVPFRDEAQLYAVLDLIEANGGDEVELSLDGLRRARASLMRAEGGTMR